MKVLTVYILPGWAEGPKVTKRLQRELKKAGFQPCQQIEEADIIITHSAGCHLLPPHLNPKFVMVINPSYWPERPTLINITYNVVLDLPSQIRDHGLIPMLRNRLWNIFYIVTAPLRTLKVWRSLKQVLFELLIHKKILIVRNNSDCFCTPDIAQITQSHKNIEVAALPGLHEDCWFNPKPYVDLLLKHL